MAVSDGLVFVGSDDNVMHAYRSDGSEAWSQALENAKAFVASPATDGQRVFGYSSSAVVTALDASSGDPLWQQPVSMVQGIFPGSPTVVGQTLYVVPYQLVALDSATGAVRWTRPNVGCFICSPAVANGTLFIGAGPASGRRLLALDAATGAPRWSFRPQAGRTSPGAHPLRSRVDGSSRRRPWARQQGVFALRVRGVDRQAPVEDARGLVAVPDLVLACGRKRNRLLHVSRWTLLCTARVDRQAAVVESDRAERILARGRRGSRLLRAGLTMYGLDARTGKTLWHARTTADPSDPAVAGGTVYVGSGDGITRAYRPPAG